MIDPARRVSDRGPRRPIRRLFIANRGEIARRIVATCERLGIEAAPAFIEGPDAVDLLDTGAVVRAAVAADADAVHPGHRPRRRGPGPAQERQARRL